MYRFRRRLLSSVIGVLASAGWTQATVPNYPTRPVRIVVALSAGSQTDILARMLARSLSDQWHQPVIVDNRPGGAGGIAGGILVNSAPDGHTLMMYSDGHAVNAALNPELLPFDTLRDIARVSKVASSPSILVVAPTLGPKSVKELVALGRSKPTRLTFGSAGIGGGLHFSSELFCAAAGFQAVHVPYKGTPEALADTMTRRVDFMFSSPGPALPLLKSGRILALAVSTSHRSAVLPDVPTVAESGMPGFEYELWQGLFAPGRTARPIIQQLNQEVARAAEAAGSEESIRLPKAWCIAQARPEEFDRFVHAEVAKLKNVVKVAGLKTQ
jgi:tripartite-type tricarboxylate transporter receptor subunit TctC